MKFSAGVLLSFSLAGLSLPVCAQNSFHTTAVQPYSAAPAAAFSSSADTSADPVPEAPEPKVGRAVARPAAGTIPVMPFSAIGFSVKAGLGGVGFDLATPLTRKLNLRGGATYFNYNVNASQDGVNYAGALKLGSAGFGVDIFPWAGAFHITPGVMLYNHNMATATANVAAGQTFTLNDQKYTSSATDPVHGSMLLTMANKVAPSLTVGGGNMIPRSGSHWSIPVEVGVMATNRPTITLAYAGTACSTDGCGDVTKDQETQANIAAEQAKLTNSLAPLRFYPIVSVGFSYSFGRKGSGVR